MTCGDKASLRWVQHGCRGKNAVNVSSCKDVVEASSSPHIPGSVIHAEFLPELRTG